MRPSAIISASAILLAGCSGEPKQQQQAAPPTVVVEQLRAQNVPNVVELPGRIEAVRTAEVRARVNGIVLARLFQEGSNIAAGQPLFRIDPREYRALVGQAEAALARAQAARTNAAQVVARYRPLVSDRSVSGQENDAAVAQLRQAEAQVAEARAQLAQNRLQLSYTTVRAPIAGRVGAAEVTEGALVSGTEATLLTRVNQGTPIYAVFTASNSAIQDAEEQVRKGGLRIGSAADVRVRLVLSSGREYPVEGRLDFTAPDVDPQTGSQTLRAVFNNPSRTLAPGQFVRGRLTAGVQSGGLTVPARAVQFRDSQASVVTVNADGVVVTRPVQLGAELGTRWIVQSGLKAGERVIVDGWQKVRPGQKVRVSQGAGKDGGASPASADPAAKAR